MSEIVSYLNYYLLCRPTELVFDCIFSTCCQKGETRAFLGNRLNTKASTTRRGEIFFLDYRVQSNAKGKK